MHAIEAHELMCTFASGRGVRGVSLQVARGTCYALLGPNGCGKSTLSRLLLGLHRPQGGRLRVLGENPSSRRHRKRCAAALDRPAHWEGASGRQNAAFAALAGGLDADTARRRVEELLELAELRDQADEPVGTYSYGMRRKLSLVQALAVEPDLLVLDEPSAGVDARFMLHLAQRIARRREAGRTTWIAGNDPDWVAPLADRVGLMDEGRLAAEGSVEQLLADLEDVQQVRLTLERPCPVAPPPPEVAARHFAQHGADLLCLLAPGPQRVVRLIEWVQVRAGPVRAVEVRRPTLRDAFLAKTGKAVDA